MLKTLPNTPERAQQELTLRMDLGTPLMAAKGFAAPEVGEAYARARELCRQVGETPELFPVLIRLGVFYLGRAEHQTALELGRQCLRLAQTMQDPACLSQAHHMLGCFLCAVGELSAARAHLEQGLTFYNSLPHHAVALRLGVEDSEVSCLNWVGRCLWALGPDISGCAPKISSSAVPSAAGSSWWRRWGGRSSSPSNSTAPA